MFGYLSRPVMWLCRQRKTPHEQPGGFPQLLVNAYSVRVKALNDRLIGAFAVDPGRTVSKLDSARADPARGFGVNLVLDRLHPSFELLCRLRRDYG